MQTGMIAFQTVHPYTWSVQASFFVPLHLPLRHPVSDAGFCEDVPRVGGIVAQLVAEPTHHVPHQLGLADPLRTPHLLEQHGVGQRAGSVDRKLVEHRVLRGRQFHGSPSTVTPGAVRSRLPVPPHRVGSRRLPLEGLQPLPERRPDPCRQIRWREEPHYYYT